MENDFEINLRKTTMNVHFFDSEYYERYKDVAGVELYSLEKIIPEGTLMPEFNNFPIEEVAQKIPPRFWDAGKIKLGKTKITGWCDLLEDITFTPEQESAYGRFLLYNLKFISLLLYDKFLDFHWNKYFNSDIKKFSRFLKLNLREQVHGKLEDEKLQTINEWIDLRTKESETETGKKIKTKGKPKREQGDQRTVLSQEQTTLLIHYLRVSRIIYPGDEYLSNQEAADAFSSLTGYSSERLRQTLGKNELAKITTSKNMTDVINSLTHAILLMKNDLKDKRKP
jgi:hypothetical protein